MADKDVVQFSRARSNNGPTLELRGDCPREIVDMLDAVSLARGLPSRNALVIEVLGEWAAEQRHQHSVIARVLAANPACAESTGAAA